MKKKTKAAIRQEISKDGKLYCVTNMPYPPEIVKSMKKAGYKVKEIKA